MDADQDRSSLGLRVASGVHRLAFRKVPVPKAEGGKHPRHRPRDQRPRGRAATRLEFSKTTRAGRRSRWGKSIFLWTYRTGSRGYLYRGTHPTCTRPEGNPGIFGVAAANQLKPLPPSRHGPTGLKGYGPARLFLSCRETDSSL